MPGEHRLQAVYVVAPSAVEYEPTRHCAQYTLTGSCEYVPVGQVVHARSVPAHAKEPAGQGLQTTFSVELQTVFVT